MNIEKKTLVIFEIEFQEMPGNPNWICTCKQSYDGRGCSLGYPEPILAWWKHPLEFLAGIHWTQWFGEYLWLQNLNQQSPSTSYFIYTSESIRYRYGSRIAGWGRSTRTNCGFWLITTAMLTDPPHLPSRTVRWPRFLTVHALIEPSTAFMNAVWTPLLKTRFSLFPTKCYPQ